MPKTLSLCLAFIAMACVSSTAQGNSSYTAPDERQTTLDGNITRISNIRYGEIPEVVPDSASDRILDLYLPGNAAGKPLPVFLFVHGGGFSGGSKEAPAAIYQAMARAGYAVISINYRLTLKYHNPQKVSASGCFKNGPGARVFPDGMNLAIYNTVEDAELALKWMKKNAGEYNFDLKNLVVGGGSAGAIAVLYMTYVTPQKVTPIKAVLNLWGGVENTSAIKKPAKGAKLPPVLTYHGDQDALVHVDYGRALQKRMEELGSTESKLVVMEGKGHAQYSYIGKSKMGEIVDYFNGIK